MEATKGIKTYGKRSVVAMLNEYKQFHNLDIFGTQDATIMSRQKKYRAIRAVNLIKEKLCGKIKGRTCADGSCQCIYIPIEEETLQTIALESLFVSLLIDDHKGRSVHTFDVPGAYLHGSLPNDKVAHMKFEGELVDIMCEVNPEYEIFVTFQKDKKVLYVLILRAVYGMI